MLIAYIDEVGEAGAFISKDHKRFNTSPALAMQASSSLNSMSMLYREMSQQPRRSSTHSSAARAQKSQEITLLRGNAKGLISSANTRWGVQGVRK